MHELPITESILSIALRHAEPAEAERITDIHLVIGQLSSVIDQSVQFYWDIVSEGTIAEGATLHFRRIPARLLCMDCDLPYTPGEGELACPDCEGSNIKVIAGDEFQLESIQIETAEDRADRAPGA
jgi:hydrogenase nickel incorporation protein HypA/HybF